MVISTVPAMPVAAAAFPASGVVISPVYSVNGAPALPPHHYPPPQILPVSQVVQTPSSPISTQSAFQASGSSTPQSRSSSEATPNTSPAANNALVTNGNAFTYSPPAVSYTSGFVASTPVSPHHPYSYPQQVFFPAEYLNSSTNTCTSPLQPVLQISQGSNQNSSNPSQIFNPAVSVPTTVTNNAIVSSVNGVMPYASVHTNLVPTLVPINQNLLQGNTHTAQNSTIISTVPYNTTFNPSIPPPTYVPYQQSCMSGASLLQCAPRLPPATLIPGTPFQIPPMSSTSVAPMNYAAYPVSTAIPRHIIPASSWKQSYGMEQEWQNKFHAEFAKFSPYTWTLFPVAKNPTGEWYQNMDSAKVRFSCEVCGHGWTSMKGRVGFWVHLDSYNMKGFVCLKLYGQICNHCKTGNFEQAMWYPEEVQKVIGNLRNRVAEVCFGQQQCKENTERRPGKPRTPHNTELCQACRDGVCHRRR